MLAARGIATVTLDAAGVPEHAAAEDGLEQFETFEENALAKARYFFERAGRRPTVADDSGLEVVALGGRPGVRTKRWSGRTDLSGRALDGANNAKMLSELAGVADRRARYVCVAAYIDGSGRACVRAARARDAFWKRRAARAASGTIRCFCPTTSASRLPKRRARRRSR